MRRYARERWPLLAFVALLTLYRATQWGHFAVPAPDFFDFEDTTQALASGHLPAQFQRAPLYPALIALISPLIGGERPALVAAEAINLAMSAGALLVMYELCAVLVGGWALLVVMLSGLHWTMAYVTVHPLCEPTLLAATLTALYLDVSGKPGKYWAAGLAAAARYEGMALIAVLALCDLWRRRGCARVALAAGLAAAPTIGWVSSGALRAAANPYVQVLVSQTPAGWEFVRSTAMSAIGFLPVQALEGTLAGSAAWAAAAATTFVAMAALMVMGVHALVKHGPRIAAPLLSFGAAYFVIHLVYAAANTRFVLPILWLLHLLAVMGAMSVARWAQTKWRIGDAWTWAAGAGLACGAGAAAVWAARSDPLWVIPLAAPVAFVIAGAPTTARGLIAALSAVALLVAGAIGLSRWYLERESRWWAELGPVARWCQAPGSLALRLAATRPALTLLRELATHPRVRFYDLAHLEETKTRAAEVIPPDVTHLLWSATDTPPPDRPPQLLLSRRYADERERLLPTGRWFVRRVAAGRVAGWRVCERFTARGQHAVIYEREKTNRAKADMEPRR